MPTGILERALMHCPSRRGFGPVLEMGQETDIYPMILDMTLTDDPDYTVGPALAEARLPRATDRSGEGSRIAADLEFLDLRGTAVTILAEAGCAVPETATITGRSHDHAQQTLDRYRVRTPPRG